MSDDKTLTDPQRWQRIQQLFHNALEVEADGRAAFVADQCGDDGDLRREVEALLTGHTQDENDLSRVVGAVADDALSESAGHLIGARVGAYELVRQLGVGGMGSVYLGERVDGHYRQQVAVKLINPAMLSEQLLARFRAERQILAGLEHPNIARLLDGGSTDDGYPYLILEYVDGVPIDQYCETAGLSTARRLAMFRTVCQAVHYAHGQLVVHRDLKPGNILVTAGGTPKLLDFGIAKLLDAGEAGGPLLSVNLRPMTPQYAAPEQIRGGRISTATDVYALGVLLYKLLTGRLPYESVTGAGTSLETLVCETDPAPPSASVSGGAASPAGGSRARQLSQTLRGDLDNIVLMALRREPERRYSSADQLSEDIRRHLARLPVIARPASWRYRLQRYGQRNWLGLVSAVAVTLVIAGLVGFYTLKLSAERDTAQRNADRAEQVAALLTGIFRLSDPGETRGREITAREILDKGAASVERELAGQPEMLAAMLNAMGTVYEGLGLNDTAATMHERALSLRRSLPAPDPADLVQSLQSLGRVRYEQGLFEAAVALQEQALALQKSRLAPDSIELADTINQLGFARFHLGEVDEAESLYRQALAIFSDAGADDSYERIVALMNYAQLREYQGDFETSVIYLTEALEGLERAKGADHPEMATGLHNLGVALHQLRRFDEAASAYQRSLEITRQLYDEDHPDVGATLGALGRMHHEQGDLAAAEPYYRDALAHARRVLGDEHAYTGYDLANLASLWLDQGDFAAADEAYREALAIYDAGLPAGHPYVASALTAYGRLLNETGRTGEAIPTLERAIAICRDALTPDHWLLATAQSELARSFLLGGRLDQAAQLLPAAYERLLAARGAQDPRTQRALRWTVELLEARGERNRAARYAERELDAR